MFHCGTAMNYMGRVLFARCLDKSMPVQCLFETIAECLDPSQAPDNGT
jgi:hypothetical protein